MKLTMSIYYKTDKVNLSELKLTRSILFITKLTKSNFARTLSMTNLNLSSLLNTKICEIVFSLNLFIVHQPKTTDKIST